MTILTFDKDAPKKAVNLSVNSDLLGRAKELGVNLSEAFEGTLAELVAAAERQRWRDEAREAIEEYNRRIEEGPMLSDIVREF
jgi:antitoxin CcdA